MDAGDVPVDRYAGRSYGIVATNGDLVIERPGLPVEGTAQDLQHVHESGASRVVDRRSSARDSAAEQSLELDIEPDALRAAEFYQAQGLLDSMVGKTVTAARVEETRIALDTSDGRTYYFYGFMGEHEPDES